MYPILIDLGFVKLYSYGFMIILGVLLGYLYMLKQGKKNGLDSENISSLYLWCFFGVIVGGKVFLILENPAYHLTHMKEFFADFGRGFVFYGSFLATIPILIWWFKKHKLNPWEQFDNVGVSGALVHGFGKIGCLLAGCCYGLVCQGNDSGLVYTNINAMADPKGVPLYPTQIWDACMLLGIVGLMLVMKARKKFHGQLFLTYGMVYAIGRFITEKYRGDESRGFLTFGGTIPENTLSHSQFIAILVFMLFLGVGIWRYRKDPLK